MREITMRVAEAVSRCDVECGLCQVFIQHTSASLVLQENADPTARADLERLKLVRERRAAEAERRKAEEEERAEQAKAKGEVNERERRMREAALGTGGKKSGRGGRKK